MNSENNNNNDVQVIDFSGMNVGPTPQPVNTDPMMGQTQVIPVQSTEPVNNEVPVLDVSGLQNFGEPAVENANVTNVNPPVENNPLPTEPAPSENVSVEAPIENNGNQSMINPEPVNTSNDVSNISYDNNDAYNEFADKKPAKKGNKFVTILLVLLVLLVAGVALWYFCIYKNTGVGVAKSNGNTIKALDVSLELGDPIPTTITTYINRDLKQTEYKLITNKINNNKIGDYEFSVTYNNETYTGTCHVRDTKGPELVINNVISKDLSNITVNNFVTSCDDISECELSFVDEDVLNNITEKGTYDIKIKASDTAGNNTILTATLTFDASSEVNMLTCVKNTNSKDYPTAKLVYSNVLNYDANDELKTLTETKTYSFDVQADYDKFKQENPDVGTFDDTKLTCVIEKNYSVSDLAKDNNKKLIPINKTKTNDFFKGNGYTCK